MELTSFIYPSIYFISGIIIGIVLENILLSRLAKLAAKTTWKGDDIIVRAFKGIILFWGIAAGAYFALHYAPLSINVKLSGNKVIFSAVVLSAAMLLGRITVGFIKTKTSHIAAAAPTASIVANLLRVIIYIVGILIILETLGISITPLITALGVGGLAVALALQETLSNFFAGIQVIVSRQVRTNDYIKLSTGEEGYVSDITWRNTTIRALSNNMIVVPNTKIASSIVTNYHLPEKEMSVLVELGVSYDSDLKQVEKVTIETAKEVLKEVTGAVREFDPFIRYHTFDNSSINFSVILRGHEFTDQYLIKHEFIKALHERYKELNIEIPFPIRTVYLKNEPINQNTQ